MGDLRMNLELPGGWSPVHLQGYRSGGGFFCMDAWNGTPAAWARESYSRKLHGPPTMFPNLHWNK